MAKTSPAGTATRACGPSRTAWSAEKRPKRIRQKAIRFSFGALGELKDFELRLTFRIDHGNSGIQYRSKQLPNNGENHWIISGYQAEVENTPGKAGFLYHERGRGYLCNVGEKVVIEDDKPMVVGHLGEKDKIGATYKKSDWNDYVIIAEGNHLRHYLNGVQTVDVIDNGPKGGSSIGPAGAAVRPAHDGGRVQERPAETTGYAKVSGGSAFAVDCFAKQLRRV